MQDGEITITHKKYYSINDLISAGFGSRTTIWRHIKYDGLPAYKFGNRVLIPREGFETFMEAHRIKNKA